MAGNNGSTAPTRRIFAVAAIVLLAGLTVWAVGPWRKLPSVETSATTNAPDLTEGRGAPAQRAAESAVGKNDPAGLEGPSGGRARAIKESSKPLSLGQPQLQQLAGIVRETGTPKTQQAAFEMMIGAAVPRQYELQKLPGEATELLNGYWGAEYTIVGDTLVIVDFHARRVVALIPLPTKT